MRWGIAPDDTHYVPVFPFPAYNRLTETDSRISSAYLRSLRAGRAAGIEEHRGSGAVVARGECRRDLTIAVARTLYA